MSDIQWIVPASVTSLLERMPDDRTVVVLLRHSVRGPLPEEESGYSVPITQDGYRIAEELGQFLGKRLKTLHSSPLLRCIQTAESLAKGAQVNLDVVPDRLLGDPGVFVLDDKLAWENWKKYGHDYVMHNLINESSALEGMARPIEASRFLVQSMLSVADGQPGVHVFVTHDSILAAVAARLLGQPLTHEDWPLFLDGAFFWSSGEGVHTAYHDYESVNTSSLCGLTPHDVIEFARREVAVTLGLEVNARFFLAGGAFKTLLTGKPVRDLDFWAPSEKDRTVIVQTLLKRGAKIQESTPFAEVFKIANRIVDVPFKTAPDTLDGRLGRFDIALSAVGVEYRPYDTWSTQIHPCALQSVNREEILLLKPLVNQDYVLQTLERMYRYARELSYSVPSSETNEVWQMMSKLSPEYRNRLIQNYMTSSTDEFDLVSEVTSRFPP